MIKILKRLIFICTVFLFAGCDKDFVEVNTNPYAANSVDPALLFAGAQRTHIGTWGAEHTIVQQFVTPYNTGANLGFNFNEDIDGVSNPKWDQSFAGGANGNAAPVKNIIHALNLLGSNTARVNLMSMLRIWKAQIFMGLVDAYGDVPYSEAGKGLSDNIFYPKYDDDAVIYDDLYKELKEATAALNPGGDHVSADLFYGTNAHASTRTTTAAAQVPKWKKLGYSLMLRLGMRYSKINTTKAQSIVAEAFAGGVMTSNADNAFVKYDGTLYTQGDNAALRNFSQFNYAAEPFVNQLKSTNDPRGKFILANFTNPGNVASQSNPDVVLANQYGVPIGVTDAQITAPGSPYRGARGGGLNYSQMNVWTVASPAAPDFWVTYAQTSLLLAEAAKRGWIPGGDALAQTYYENGITADMAAYSLYPGTAPISAGEIATYIADPGVAYNATDALQLINTQYWIVNLRNGTEAFANFRRSGFPALSPNLFNNKLNGGFVRRLSYPDVEASANTDNYNAAATAIGGDKLTSKVFWDN
ncbi:MAG TPA: SusD/RagB family nutrient-binding outer membrane lipoprotein [Chitinophagaceae bacterium]|nr:SusD/RagB family nutrient-binding outer membrane lipoprotein [Chitinophagaceae bacterium]